MGRAPCCDKTKVKRGPWSPDEDNTLKNFVEKNGTGGNWIALPQKAGLRRCGKSCRLRWLNYLRPDINHGAFTEEEDNIILTIYSQIGSRWSVIAANLQGRTDNDVKNHWNTKLKKKLLAAAEITNFSSNYNSVLTQNYCATESTCSVMNSNNLTSLVNPNLTNSSILVPEMLNVETSCQFPLPGLMEIQENGAITTLQEDGNYLMDFSSGISSTYYDILNGFDFQEKAITADPNCSSSSCSTLVQQQGYIPDIDQYPFKGVEN